MSITDALIGHLRERERIGLKKYGCRLEAFNGRSSAQDALEEALDLTQYLMQLQVEWGRVRAESQEMLGMLIDAAADLRKTHPEHARAIDDFIVRSTPNV